MLPLATKIHTSVIHLATSHRTDPLSHVLSHLAPRHCSLLTLPAYYVSVSLVLFLLPSPHGAHQHTKKNRLTVSLPRQSKETEESIYRYRLLLLTGERPQRWGFFHSRGRKRSMSTALWWIVCFCRAVSLLFPPHYFIWERPNMHQRANPMGFQ